MALITAGGATLSRAAPLLLCLGNTEGTCKNESCILDNALNDGNKSSHSQVRFLSCLLLCQISSAGLRISRCNWAKTGTRSHLAQPISALAAPAGGWSSPESPSTLCHSILPKRKALLGQATKTMPGLRQGCDHEALTQPIADLPVQGFGFELAFLEAFQM